MVLLVGHKLGKTETEVMSMNSGEFARWVVYFTDYEPKHRKEGS